MSDFGLQIDRHRKQDKMKTKYVNSHCGKCGEKVNRSKSPIQDSELLCPKCWDKFTEKQDEEYDREFGGAENMNIYGSGLSDCSQNPVNKKQRQAGRVTKTHVNSTRNQRRKSK